MYYFNNLLILFLFIFSISGTASGSEKLALFEDSYDSIPHKSSPFKKLREQPKDFNFTNFREIMEIMDGSFALKPMEKDSNQERIYEGHFQESSFTFIITSMTLLTDFLKHPDLPISIALVKGPDDVLVATQLEYEFILPDSSGSDLFGKRIDNFLVTYVSDSMREIATKVPAVNRLQRRKSQSALGKFVERSSPRLNVLSQAEKELKMMEARSLQKAGEAKKKIEKRYPPLLKSPQSSSPEEKSTSDSSGSPSGEEADDPIIAESSDGLRKHASLRQRTKSDALISPRSASAKERRNSDSSSSPRGSS